MMDCREMPKLAELNIPYYVQIYDIIYQLIQEEKLKEGDTLPGENILADYWNVSRSTVRMAVRKLEEDGYIYKMQDVYKRQVWDKIEGMRDETRYL